MTFLMMVASPRNPRSRVEYTQSDFSIEPSMWLSRNNLCLVGILSLALFQQVSISEAKRMRENKNRESRREGKGTFTNLIELKVQLFFYFSVFSLFSIVSFNNDPCQSTSTSTG